MFKSWGKVRYFQNWAIFDSVRKNTKTFFKKVPRLSLKATYPKYEKLDFFAYNVPPKTASFWSKSVIDSYLCVTPYGLLARIIMT